MSTDSKKEILLVLRSQAGDKEAFDQLLASIQFSLWRYILGLVGNREDAEDVLQEVFMITYRKLKWLNEPKCFRAWAYRVASRESFRYLKKQARRGEEMLEEDQFLEQYSTAPDEPIYEPELITRIPDLLSTVSPASRAVLILHYLDGLSVRDTAEVLDISIGTAKSRLGYGLAILRKRMKNGARL